MKSKTRLPWVSRVFVVGFLVGAVSSGATTLEQVLEKHRLARGEGWADVEALEIRGLLTMPSLELPMTVWGHRPNRLRMEIEFGEPTGARYVRAFDGTVGWGIMALQGQLGPADLEGVELNRLRRQADFEGPLVEASRKGHRIEFLGFEEREGRRLLSLRVTLRGGFVVHSFLDPDYFLEVRQEFRDELEGREVDVVVTFDDYREVGGLNLSHSIRQRFVGSEVETHFQVQGVTLDPTLEDSFFQRPEEADRKGSTP